MNDKRPEETKGIDHQRLPVGTCTGQVPKGEYTALPLFGWVSLRDKTGIPLVMLGVILLKDGETSPAGSLSVELPVYPETEDAIVACLSQLGWDARVWPVEDGWPNGDEDNEGMLNTLMETAKLRATLTFPPGPEGVAAMAISVQRSKGPFLMPPLPKPEGEVDPKLKARLRELCENPKVFHRPVKPAIFV